MANDPIQEAEANLFAMALLMPEELVRKELAKGIDIAEDEEIKKLAKKFQVPIGLMAIRIGQIMERKNED